MFRVGGLLSCRKFTLDDRVLRYHYRSENVAVRRKDIETVSVEAKTQGMATLKIAGHGTTLASIDLPQRWAEVGESWLLQQLEPDRLWKPTPEEIRTFNDDTLNYVLAKCEMEVGFLEDACRTLDTKASTLLGFTSAVLLLMLPFGSTALGVWNSLVVSGAWTIMVVFLLSALAMLGLILWPRTVAYPQYSHDVPDGLSEPPKTLIAWHLAAFLRSMKYFDKVAERKSRLFKRAVVCLFVAVGLAAILTLCWLWGVGR